MIVFYYNILDVFVWSFVVVINKNCKCVLKNNYDLCNILEDLYIILVGDFLWIMLFFDCFGYFMVNGLFLFIKFLKGGLFFWIFNKGKIK